MHTDIASFVFPDGNRLEVHADGRVLYTSHEVDNPYGVEADLSKSRLGALLRAVLLEVPLRGTSLEGRNRGGLLKGPHLSIECLSASGGVLSASANCSQGKTDTSFLKQEVKTQLLSAGIPADEVEFFGTVAVYVEILNKTRNPVKTAAKFRSKDSYPRRFSSWLERRKTKPTAQNGGDSAAPQVPEDSNDDIELLKGMAFNIED